MRACVEVFFRCYCFAFFLRLSPIFDLFIPFLLQSPTRHQFPSVTPYTTPIFFDQLDTTRILIHIPTSIEISSPPRPSASFYHGGRCSCACSDGVPFGGGCYFFLLFVFLFVVFSYFFAFFPFPLPFFTSFPCRKADICAYTVVCHLSTLHLVYDANIYCSPYMQHADMMHTHATLKSRRPPTPMPVSLRDCVYNGAR